MKPEARVKLLSGPYVAPAVEIGQDLHCAIRGPLKIRRFSTGPIAWPMGHPGGQNGGRHSYIVCGDLVHAVQLESSQAVQHWWGVSEVVVNRWRQALGVGINTEGTRHLRAMQSAGHYPPERLTQHRATVLSHTPPKTHPIGHGEPWQAEEEVLLGTLPDAQVAAQIGRTLAVVRAYRKAHGIFSLRDKRSRAHGLSSGKVRLSGEKLCVRRLTLGLLPVQVAERVGFSQERYRSYEKYAWRQVDPGVVDRLAAILSCQPDGLILSFASYDSQTSSDILKSDEPACARLACHQTGCSIRGCAALGETSILGNNFVT